LENETVVGIITVTDFLDYAAKTLAEDVIPG
jgi:hypothetical protein